MLTRTYTRDDRQFIITLVEVPAGVSSYWKVQSVYDVTTTANVVVPGVQRITGADDFSEFVIACDRIDAWLASELRQQDPR